MKTIGLLGGMSWQSTVTYYRHLNREVQRRLGGLHSASIVMDSGDFAVVDELQRLGMWRELGERLGERARALAASGARALVICSNTIHRLAPEIAGASGLACIHVVESVTSRLLKSHAARVALLATSYTRESHIYEEGLARHGIAVLLPSNAQQAWIDELIYGELCRGVLKTSSRERLMEIVERLRDGGADAVILGCTELGLLIDLEPCAVPMIDTTYVHAIDAIDFALSNDVSTGHAVAARAMV